MNLVLPQTSPYAICNADEFRRLCEQPDAIAWVEYSDRQGDDWHNRHVCVLNGFVFLWDERIAKEGRA